MLSKVRIKMIHIKTIKHGIAWRGGDTIYINRKFLQPQYHDLFRDIMAHELQHSADGFRMSDLVMDLKSSLTPNKVALRIALFCLKNPLSFLVQASPVIWVSGRFHICWLDIIFAAIAAAAIAIIIW